MPSNIRPFELDALSIMRVRSMPDGVAAAILDDRMRLLERQYRRSFAERGFIFLEVEQRELWKLINDPKTGVPFTSKDSWICSAAVYSRSDCYAALAAVKDLRDISAADLLEIPRCNIPSMRKLSSAVRRLPEVVQAAQTLSAKDFVKQVNASWPEQHLQEASVVDEAVEVAMFLEDLSTKEEVFEMWAVEYLTENRARYEELKRESCYTTAASTS